MKKSLKQCLGIDVSKDSLSLCLSVLDLSLKKEFVHHPDVSNDEKGFDVIQKWLKKNLDNSVDFWVLLEATGVYHQQICHYLHALGYQVCVMQSGRVKRYAQSLDQRSKTDALDSKMLSMLGLERSLRQWFPPNGALQHLKILSRERITLLKTKTTESNRQKAISSSSYVDKKVVKRHQKRLDLIDKQVVEIEEEMRELVATHPELKERIGHLESIPGVSFISAVTVVGETLGFEGITSGKQLASYAGYDVVLRESGSFKGKTKISKRGNSHIRAVLHMPSMTCVRLNPTLKPFYERLKPNKPKPIVALIAVQRKLLILMYTLWKNETTYDPKYEEKKAAKTPDPCCAG